MDPVVDTARTIVTNAYLWLIDPNNMSGYRSSINNAIDYQAAIKPQYDRSIKRIELLNKVGELMTRLRVAVQTWSTERNAARRVDPREITRTRAEIESIRRELERIEGEMNAWIESGGPVMSEAETAGAEIGNGSGGSNADAQQAGVAGPSDKEKGKVIEVGSDYEDQALEPGIPTLPEIRDAIPAEGITLRELTAEVDFTKDNLDEMSKLVKEVADMDRKTELMMPKPNIQI